MLDKAQLTALFDRLQTPQAGRNLVLRARVEAPVRAVESRGGNVPTFFASQKMAGEIRTESRHIEFAGLVEKEFNPDVLEYYAQPCLLKLELVDKATGEFRTVRHYPDFLEIRADGITLEEWKSDAKLTGLAERYPYRYARTEDGGWYSEQIEAALEPLGIHYRIRTDRDIPGRRVENLLFLEDYWHPAAEPCPPTVLSTLHALLKEHGFLFIADLTAKPHDLAPDQLFKAIADHLVVADLDNEQLSDPRRCRLYRDETLRDFMVAQAVAPGYPGRETFVVDVSPGAQFEFEGQVHTVSLLGECEVVLTRQGGISVTVSRSWLDTAISRQRVTFVGEPPVVTQDLSRVSEAELQTALRRQEVLKRGGTNAVASSRTLRRWMARQAIAVACGSNKVLALVPKTASRGNRTVRLSPEQLAVVEQVIEQKWCSHEAVNYRACHNFLVEACAQAGIAAPSYPTLVKKIQAQETDHDRRTRNGKRMAYQEADFVQVLYVNTPVHGSRPFQYVHIDHTQLDLELISSRTGKPLGRPWLSFAVDANTRRILAIYLTFNPPSVESVMMVVRDMVRRHGRLPQFIVVDNGADFRATAFGKFLEAMGVHLRPRPPGQPRHGAVLERVFGTAHTQYVHNLAGNTKAMKNVRMVTGKHMPVHLAEWSLEPMYFGIEYWAFVYYDQHHHPALDCSPQEAFMRGVRQSGERPQRCIRFGEDFLIATCPPVDRTGSRRVDNQRGVKVADMHYWSPEFREEQWSGQSVPVRYDPWDASSVYVRLKDRWVRARCRNLLALGQLTDFERRALSEEYVHRSGTAADKEQDAQRLREFMQVFTPEGAMALAFEREAENKSLYNRLQLSSVNPVAAPAKTRLIEEPRQESTPAVRMRPSTDITSEPSETPAADHPLDFELF